MISLTLNDSRNFMSHLLLSDTFDHFLLVEGELVTCFTLRVEGFAQKAFFQKDDPELEQLEDYIPWQKVRELFFSQIKGKRTPLNFRFVFRLSRENTERLIRLNQLDFQPSNVQGLYLNLRFDGSHLQCITGTSLSLFTPDKSLEHAWDLSVQKFLANKDISFESDL